MDALQIAAHCATLTIAVLVILGAISYILTHRKRNKVGNKMIKLRLPLLHVNDELVASIDAMLQRPDIAHEEKVLAHLLAIRTYLSDIRYAQWLDIQLTHGISSPLPS